jgi:hypothetical protein
MGSWRPGNSEATLESSCAVPCMVSLRTMGTRLTPVALDIETTGFGITEAVTVLGFSLPMGCRVFCYTGGRSAEQTRLEESLRSREYMLVAHNGELYRGGFDLPFCGRDTRGRGLTGPSTGCRSLISCRSSSIASTPGLTGVTEAIWKGCMIMTVVAVYR